MRRGPLSFLPLKFAVAERVVTREREPRAVTAISSKAQPDGFRSVAGVFPAAPLVRLSKLAVRPCLGAGSRPSARETDEASFSRPSRAQTIGKTANMMAELSFIDC